MHKRVSEAAEIGGEKSSLVFSFLGGFKDDEETVVWQFQFLPPGVPTDLVQLGFYGSRGSVCGWPTACKYAENIGVENDSPFGTKHQH